MSAHDLFAHPRPQSFDPSVIGSLGRMVVAGDEWGGFGDRGVIAQSGDADESRGGGG